MRELLSVIIPVYNTEHTLERTVSSVQSQTWDNIEIILVDDCSPDNAGELCDRLAGKDNRIKVIHKLNEGLGLTRNAGLRMATGKYVAFLDSDDWMEKDAYEKCILSLKENSAQACYYGRKVYKADGSYSVVKNIPTKLVFHGDEVINEFAPRYFGDWGFNPEEIFIRESSCCALYDRELIEKNCIDFKSERVVLSEDIFFNLDVCRYADGIVIIPEYLYNQGDNPSSLTRKRDVTRFPRSKNLYKELVTYSKNYPEITNVDQRLKYRMISLIRGLIRDEVANITSLRETYSTIKSMVADEVVRDIFINFDDSVLDEKSRLFIKWVRECSVIPIVCLYRLKAVKNRFK